MTRRRLRERLRILVQLSLQLLVLLSICCWCATRLSVASEAPRRLVLADVTAIDPASGGAPRRHVDIVVEGERIARITPHAASGEWSEGARVLDLAGSYALPGFVDMHVHTLLCPRDAAEGRLVAAGPAPDTTRQMLRTLLAFGITTIRDPGDPTEGVVRLKRALASGQLTGPAMLTAGRILSSEPVGPEFVQVSNAAEVRAEIATQADAGVDFIKVYSGLGPDLVKVAIESAHRRGLGVIGHLGATTWTEAANLGIDAICHGAPWSPAYLDPARRRKYPASLFGRVYWLRQVDLGSRPILEMAAAMAAHHVALDPTLIALHTKFWGDDARYLRSPELRFAPAEYLAGWPRGSFTAGWSAAQYQAARQQWPREQALIRLLARSGVLLTVGTDTPTPWIVPGVSFHQELALLHEAGLPIADVLRFATRNAAVALHREHDIGTLAPGFRADLVILSSDPLARIENTRAIRLVLKGGQLFPAAPGQE